MAEIRFYHLQRQRLDEALPKLMEKVYETGQKALIKFPDEQTRNAMDKALWAYDAASFLPHDQDGCKAPETQPVYLTCSDENPNDSTIQIVVNAVAGAEPEQFHRCLYMFDGRDERIVGQARLDWKKFKALGIDMSYWQQKETGGWEQKA